MRLSGRRLASFRHHPWYMLLPVKLKSSYSFKKTESFLQYLLSAYYVPGSLLGAEDATAEKTNWPFCEVGGIFHFDELMLKKGTGKVSVI